MGSTIDKQANQLTRLADAPRRRAAPDKQDKSHLTELTALTEAGLAIVRSQLDVDALCELVHQHVSGIVDAHSFHLGLFEGDRFTLKVWIKDGVRQPPTSFAGVQNSGIIGWMRATQEPLLVRDFELEMGQLPAQPSYTAESPPRSAVFVPLVTGDQVVGSMSVQHPEPDAYDDDDLRLLSIIANQAASAIDNARLLAVVQHRAQQLSTIADVSRAITAVLDLDDLLAKVVELIREHFGYYHVQIYLVENETHRAIFRASTGHHLNELWRKQGRSLHFDEGIIGWVAGSGRHLLANDVSAEPRYIADSPRLLPDTRSELAVPLKIEDRVLGVLDVQGRARNAFSQDDLFVLNALANQVAVAVDAARSYQAQQEEAWTTTVLLQVAEATSRSDSLEDVLATVTRLIPMLSDADSCGLWLWDRELDSFDLVSSHGLRIPWEEAQSALRLRPTVDPALALTMLQQTLRPVELSIDRPNDKEMLPAAFWQAMPGDSLILLPLLVQNKQIGCLGVSANKAGTPLRLHQRRLNMLSGIASQAAAAIDNVRLTTAHEEEAWISWALLEVSQTIGNARSVEQMLEHVVRLVPLLAGVDRCAALLYEPETGDFVAVREYLGHGAQVGRFGGQRLRPGELPLLDLARTTGQIQRAADVIHNEMVPARWAREVGSKTLVALPLLAQEEVLGVLLVDDTGASHMISQRREDILAGIARQVGLALDNFRLLVRERERLRLIQELQVARRIQSSFLPATTPQTPGYQLAHAWRSAHEVGGDFYDFVPLRNGRLGLLMADVADKGVPAALFMATSLTVLRASAHDSDSPQRVLTRANRLISANNSTDMFVSVWYGVLDPASHRVIFANAGHSLALHVQATEGQIRRLRTPGLPLGIFDPPGVGQGACSLEPGDLLVLYTDGVIDALDEAGQEFGQDRLESILFGRRLSSADDIVESILAALRAHLGSAAVFDDITLLVAKRNS